VQFYKKKLLIRTNKHFPPKKKDRVTAKFTEEDKLWKRYA